MAVTVASIESAEVNLVVDEVIECVFDGAGKKLPLKINGKKSRAGVDMLVTGHGDSPKDLPL